MIDLFEELGVRGIRGSGGEGGDWGQLTAPVAPSGSGKSGRGLPHSKTWRIIAPLLASRSVVECGWPLPLFPTTALEIGNFHACPNAGRALVVRGVLGETRGWS